MAPGTNDLLRGTLELLVLRAVRDEVRHGWAIQQRINELARGALTINQGSLYPALVRMQKRGLLSSEYRTSPAGRRARYYRPTAKGLRQLDTRISDWRRYVQAVQLILDSA